MLGNSQQVLLQLFYAVHCMFYVAALAVYVRSPAAYEALKGFNLLQLPSRSTLQAYTGAFIDDPGKICMDTH